MQYLLIDFGVPFGLGTPYSFPLGGSETSLLLLAKGLSELGDEVILANNCSAPESNKNINLINFRNLTDDIFDSCDIVIVNRIPMFDFSNVKKPIFCYMHDAYDQPNCNWLFNHHKFSNIDILCVSEWQKQTFNNFFGIRPEKMTVVGNSIDYHLYHGYTEKNPNRLIFASVPYKGIEVIRDIFNDVCVRSKKELELHVFSSMGLYGRKDDDKEYQRYFDALKNTKGVFLREAVSMAELALELKKSSVYIHPNKYHETFGMVLVQAQASGCIPVTTDKGAVNEVIRNGETGIITKGKNIENISTYNEYVDAAVELLNRDKKNMVLEAEKYALNWNYIKVAHKIQQIVKGRLNGR